MADGRFDDSIFDSGLFDDASGTDEPATVPATSLLLVELSVLSKSVCHLEVLR